MVSGKTGSMNLIQEPFKVKIIQIETYGIFRDHPPASALFGPANDGNKDFLF